MRNFVLNIKNLAFQSENTCISFGRSSGILTLNTILVTLQCCHNDPNLDYYYYLRPFDLDPIELLSIESPFRNMVRPKIVLRAVAAGILDIDQRLPH